GNCGICERVLEIFVGIYGAEAGNLALKLLATGGVFVSGGIASRILPRLTGPTFIQAFTAKGRLQPLMETIPVRVIINDKVGLLGAARYAFDLSRAERCFYVPRVFTSRGTREPYNHEDLRAK